MTSTDNTASENATETVSLSPKGVDVPDNVSEIFEVVVNRKYNKVPVDDKKVKYCFSFFGSDRECTVADGCPFSHDVAGYMKLHNLKNCPSKDCVNYCRVSSTKCSMCTRVSVHTVKPCFAIMRGDECDKGDKCPFSHDKSEWPARPVRYCFAFFGRERNCDKGDECTFSHDADGYKSARGLKDCPNDGCDSYCMEASAQCSSCVKSVNRDRFDKRKNSPCFAFFGRERNCDKGDECPFSHDAEKYKADRGLKDCPTDDCNNYCRDSSDQCSTCTNTMRANNNDSREMRLCQGYKCSEFTPSRFCHDCYDDHRRYVLNRE